MTKRQRSIAQEDFPVFNSYNSITAGMKDFTVKVKDSNGGGQYVIQRAPNPSTAAMRVREAFPDCKILVIDSKEATPWRRDERI